MSKQTIRLDVTGAQPGRSSQQLTAAACPRSALAETAALGSDDAVAAEWERHGPGAGATVNAAPAALLCGLAPSLWHGRGVSLQ